MAQRRWIGGAAAVTQVDTLTVGGTIEADDVFIVTLTAEDGSTQSESVTAGSTVAATVATTIAAALNASKKSLFTAITWAADAATVTATADTAGVPFYCAASTTEAGGGAADDQTFARAATTANQGPNDWNTAMNWFEQAVPVDADEVYLDEGSEDILYGLDQSDIDLDELHKSMLFTGLVGGAEAGEYLRFGTVTAAGIEEYSGTGTPLGSRRFKLDTGSTACAATVHNSASSAYETGQHPIQLKMNHASSTLTVLKGKVALGVGTGVTGEIATLTIGYVSNRDQDSDVIVGSGMTVATVVKNGGKLLQLSGATTLTNNAGGLQTEGTGAFTTIAVNGGVAILNSAGTIGNLDSNGGLTDMTHSPVARTVSDWDVAPGATIVYDPNVVTVTSGPTFAEAMRIVTTKLY